MNTKKKKNRIILCICSIFLLVASIFSFIPLTKESKFVYADTVTSDYSFSGSNISSKTTFNKGLFTKQLLQNTLVGFELSSTYDLVIYEKEEDISYPLHFYVKGDLSDPLVPSSALFQYDYSDGTKSYSTGVTFGTGRQNFLSVSFDGAKDLTKITLINWCECYGSIEFAQLEEGDSFTGFVPYENSTYLNYKFDFKTTSYIGDDSLIYFQSDLTYSISNDMDYRLYRVISDANFNTIGILNNAYNSLPFDSYIYCSPYDTTTESLDQNYKFTFYYSSDYVESMKPGIVFNGDIKYIVLGSYKDASSYFHFEEYVQSKNFFMNAKYNFISYVDSNGYNLNFFIPLDSKINSDYFDYRTYFLSSEDITSIAYSQGYRTGYTNGETTGYNNGYTNGYNIGKNDGYNLGYNTALNNDKYSFVSLISSVVDVPLKAFTSLFNFEILGVNLSGFFLGLLTCCIVIGIIRLIL